MSEASTDSSERREFYRIDDEVVLHYRVLAEGDEDRLDAVFQGVLPDRFTMAASFAASSRQMQSWLRQIRNNDSSTAQYLESLDYKLNLLARMFVVEELESQALTTRVANISGGGMSFCSPVEVRANQNLEIKVVLLPDLTGVLVMGKVVYCEYRPESDKLMPYHVAVEFERIREADRDLLVKHVLSKDAAARRKARDADKK